MGHETPVIPIRTYSHAERLAMRKMVRLEKKRKASNKTLDSHMIADPPGNLAISFESWPTYDKPGNLTNSYM